MTYKIYELSKKKNKNTKFPISIKNKAKFRHPVPEIPNSILTPTNFTSTKANIFRTK